MGPLTTQTTLGFLDKAEYLAKSILTQMGKVSLKLADFFSLLPPVNEGEPDWPNWTSVQKANTVRLQQAIAEAHQASQAYLAAKALVTETLNLRNDLVKNLKQRYRNLRASYRSTYKNGALALVGLLDPPVRAYLAFREQCLFVTRRLRWSELIEKLGEPIDDQSSLDTAKIVSGLETALAGVERAIADLREHQKLRDEALIAKQEAEDRLRTVYVNVAKVQEGYYRMAGLEELADRIRLTVPAKPRKPSKDPDPPEDTDSSEVIELMA